MEDHNINVFISSKMRDTNSKPCKFTANFPSGLIQCNENQGININIVSFDILNSFYNINENNNVIKFYISETTDGILNEYEETLVLETGNYPASRLADMINNFSHVVECEYSKIRNKFTFLLKSDVIADVEIDFGNVAEVFGLNQNDVVSIHHGEFFESPNPANLMYFNKVIIRVSGIDFELASLENISNDKSSNVFYRSNILLWLSRNDYIPFQMISYNNEDAGTSYCYNIFNKNINSLTFEITNEHGELIDEALDWSMALQFTIYNKKDDAIVKELQIHTSYLRELFVFMNVFYGILIGRR